MRLEESWKVLKKMNVIHG